MVENKIMNDPKFAAGFAIDNNYLAIKAKMNSIGIFPKNKQEAYQALLQLGSLKDKSKLMTVLDVPYVNSATNGTGGMREFFVTKTTAPTEPVSTRSNRNTEDDDAKKDGFNWNGLLNILGNTIGGIAAGYFGAGSSGPEPTQAEILAAQQAAEDAKARRTWLYVGGGVLVAILLGYVIWKARK